MKKHKGVLAALSAGAAVFTVTALLLPFPYSLGWCAGNLVGLIAAAVHFLIIRLIRDMDYLAFLERYFLGILFRFLLTLGLFTTLLLATNIEQISFTLSFIISYIFYSVIEMILITRTFASRSF